MSDNNNQGNKPRRSIFTYILPYIFIAILVILIIYFAATALAGNGGITWTVDDLDTVLRYDPTGTKSHTATTWGDDSYYIINANVSQSYKSVSVSGTAMTYDSRNRYSYTVRMEEDVWNDQFQWYNSDTGEYVAHESYSTLFKQCVEESKSEFPSDTGVYYNVSDAFQASWWDTWGPTIILIVGVALLSLFFFSRLNSSVNGSNSQAMNFNKSPARRENNSKVRFSDVAGCDEEKAEMVELVEYLKNPKKYSKFGARLPKGVLLIGNPGTGKTLLAKAVAGEAGVPFFSISGSDFVEMFVGVGAGRVRDLFRTAKKNAPCIVFIDEIDAVGRQRGAGLGGGNDEREQTLNQLLVEMDGFDYNAGILVIAATNREDVLDPALLRPGRFDRIITVSLPDRAGREAIFKVHARNKKVDPSVDFGALAKRTVGFSGADIANIMNDAAILAVRFNKESIGMAEIDEAIDRRISGPAKSGKGMNDQERKEVAYHEAGHAVVGLTLPYSMKVQKITIIPRGKTGGHVLMTPDDDRFLLTKNELIAEITGLLGGRSAEELFFDDISTGASNDIQEATRLARSMVTEYGMSELGPIQYEQATGSVFLGRDYTNTQRNFSSEVAFEIDKAVRAIIEEAHQQALDILKKRKKDVILIAETLLERETITAEQIDELIKNGSISATEKEMVKEVDPNAIGSEPAKAPEQKAEEPAKPEAKEDAKPADEKPADEAPKRRRGRPRKNPPKDGEEK
jgi:cell division protease FtsH